MTIRDAVFSLVELCFPTLSSYNGSIPITLLETGQQWDWPNVWPPTTYIMVKAVENLARNISQDISFANYSQDALDFAYLPSNHFVIPQAELPGQPILGQTGSNLTTVMSIDELGNVGNSSAMGWADGLGEISDDRHAVTV